MRIAALIFGLLAGLAAGLMLALGDIETSLAALPAFAPQGTLIARLLVYLVPAVGWIGTGIVLARPRLGGALLLLSAAGWAALAFAAGHGAILFAALPFTFAAAAGIVAMFRRRPAEARAAAERMPKPGRSRAVEAPEKLPSRRLAEPAPPPERVMRPQTATARTRIVEPSAAPAEAAFAPLIPPPFQDEVAVDEAAVEEAATNEVAMDDAPPAGVPEDDPVAPIAAALATAAVPPTETPAAASERPLPEVPAAGPGTAGGEPIAAIGAAAPAATVGAEPAGDTATTSAAPTAPADPDAATLRARRPGDWSLPTPAAPSRTRYVAEQQSVPLARTTSVSVTIEPGAADAPQRPLPIEPVAAAIALPPAAAKPESEPAPPPPPAAEEPPETADTAAATLDFAPADDYGRGSTPPPERAPPAAAPMPATRERLSRRLRRDPEAEAAPPVRRHGGIRAILRGAIAAAFVVIVLGGAGAIYLDYLRGPNSLLFGHRPAATHPAAPAAKAAPATARPAPKPAAPERTSAAPVPAVATPAPAAAPEASPPTTAPAPPATTVTPAKADDPAPSAATPAAAAPTALTFTDPVRYCATVRNIDAPDSHYTGPAVPPAVAIALLLPKAAPANQVHWRCAGGVALACNANGTHACDPTPTVQHMLDYCAKHPGASAMPAPNGSWSCNGTRPVIPENQSWPVDSRGFYPDAWVRVSPISGG